MPPLIKDYVEYRKVDLLSNLTSAGSLECLKTFLATDNLLELASRILDSISKKLKTHSKSMQEPASILLTGGCGVGKTHLLSVLFHLISQRGTLASGLSDPRIQSNIAEIRNIEPLCIWIDLAEQTESPLPELVLTRIHNEYQKRFHKEVIDPSVVAGINTIKAHELITFNIASESPILLVIDGLTKRAARRDSAELNSDIEFLSFMGYSSKSARLFLIVAAHEEFFSPKSPLGIDSTLMAQTLENLKIEWIDRANIKEIIVRYIFKKSPRQQQDVKKLFSFIKAKLPHFQFSENEFCDTYPFHPLIFDLAEKIKSKVGSFSLLEFVSTTYPKAASHRAISLITIDAVFDRLEYEIKNTPSTQRLYALYTKLAEEAVPRLQDRFRLWGKMLLKAIFLFTLSDRNPSVRDLTDALLLFEDSEGLSYNLIGMLLGQLEKVVDGGFTTTDERLDRTYRLGSADLQEEFDRYFAKVVSQISDSDVRLSEILPEAGSQVFPDWLFGASTTSNRDHRASKVFWRGTERLGYCLFSERFPCQRDEDPSELLSLAAQLPKVRDPFEPAEFSAASVSTAVDGPLQPPEWLLWIEPITAAEALPTPTKATEIHWLPAQPSEQELIQLKRALALRLTERSINSDFPDSDLSSLREELRGTLASIFRELYFCRGKIVTTARSHSFNQGHLECRTFRSFLSYLLKPNLDQLYGMHPEFGGELLLPDHVLRINRDLLSGQDPTNREVQRLAGKFALPLGLVSQADGLYELNLGITPPIFLTQVTQYLETIDATEKPVQTLFEIVHRSPFGLNEVSLQLILLALVADGQIELYNPSTSATISRENCGTVESLIGFEYFRRIPSHKDYPLEVLTQWCRLVTGQQELSDISNTRGREAATNALNEWLRGWLQLGVPRRLDNLPNEFLTTSLWRSLTWTKHRFEKVAETVHGILQKELTLIQGIAKIVDLFAENVTLLEKASRDLVELSHFLQWMEHFRTAREYLLAAENTQTSDIEDKRERLLSLTESPHQLTKASCRGEFDNLFREFQELFIDYYAAQHDQTVGPMAKFERLIELECAPERQSLQLLSALPMGDSSFIESLDEWIEGFRDCQCTLPVRDLLWQQPCCQCSFKLSQLANMDQILADLKSFLKMGIEYHRHILSYYRPALEAKFASASSEKTEMLRCFFDNDSDIPQLTQGLIEDIHACLLDNSIHGQSLAIPSLLPKGTFNKKELQTRIQEWLDGLTDDEGVLFSIKSF